MSENLILNEQCPQNTKVLIRDILENSFEILKNYRLPRHISFWFDYLLKPDNPVQQEYINKRLLLSQMPLNLTSDDLKKFQNFCQSLLTHDWKQVDPVKYNFPEEILLFIYHLNKPIQTESIHIYELKPEYEIGFEYITLPNDIYYPKKDKYFRPVIESVIFDLNHDTSNFSDIVYLAAQNYENKYLKPIIYDYHVGGFRCEQLIRTDDLIFYYDLDMKKSFDLDSISKKITVEKAYKMGIKCCRINYPPPINNNEG